METYGRSVRDLARAAGVTERTARRWKASGRVPRKQRLILQGEDLASAAPAWAGWRLTGDRLYTPEGIGYPPASIRETRSSDRLG